MLLFELLAERKIEEAVSRGELDDLPGRGAPLDLEEDPLVPQDLRAVHRVLKNAGFVPPEVDQVNQVTQLERLVSAGNADARAMRKLALLKTRLEAGYHDKVLGRLG